MKTHDLNDLDGCLDLAERCGKPIKLLGVGRLEDQYMRVHLEFVRRYGDPDSSFDGGSETLKVSNGMFAIWDFDYYQLVLRFEQQCVTLCWQSLPGTSRGSSLPMKDLF